MTMLTMPLSPSGALLPQHRPHNHPTSPSLAASTTGPESRSEVGGAPFITPGDRRLLVSSSSHDPASVPLPVTPRSDITSVFGQSVHNQNVSNDSNTVKASSLDSTSSSPDIHKTPRAARIRIEPTQDNASASLPPAPVALPQPNTGLRASRHRKNAYSTDCIPKQTIIKALVSRPPATSNMSINSLNGILAENKKFAPPAHLPARRLSEALASVDLDAECLTATKVAALASPCFFHKKFDAAVDLGRVIDEIKDDDSISHSRLMQTATGVREVSKQLQRKPIKMTFKNIMIITKARDNELVHLTRELAEWLLTTPRYGSEVGVNVYVDAKLRTSRRFNEASLLRKNPRFQSMLRYWTPDLCWTSPEKFDLVLTLGGDGTVLFTSWLFQRIVPPVLSFSLGSLGFLTNFQYEEFRESLDRVMSESGMRVNLRMRFTCTVYRATNNAITSVEDDHNSHMEAEQYEVLNELVIDRGPSPYVSQLELYGDDHLLTVVAADGCIFSTPTGSTAYSLSAGGSLVHPDIPAILLTPICPHTLSFRPMLLNDTMLLRVAVPRNSRATAYCSFDGKGRVELRAGDHVTIAASQYPLPTVLSQPTEWFDSISRTLRWNTRAAHQKGWDEGKKSYEEKFDEENGGIYGGREPEFDIDIDEPIDNDSGYSAASSSVGVATPMWRGTGVFA